MTLSLMHPTNDHLSIRGARFSEKNGHLENIYGLRVIVTITTRIIFYKGLDRGSFWVCYQKSVS